MILHRKNYSKYQRGKDQVQIIKDYNKQNIFPNSQFKKIKNQIKQ